MSSPTSGQQPDPGQQPTPYGEPLQYPQQGGASYAQPQVPGQAPHPAPAQQAAQGPQPTGQPEQPGQTAPGYAQGSPASPAGGTQYGQAAAAAPADGAQYGQAAPGYAPGAAWAQPGDGSGNVLPPSGQPPLGGDQPRRRRGRVIAWTAGGTAVALVAAGFGGFALVAQASQRGADSASSAIERLDKGFREKNLTELAKLVSPSEARPFFENFKALGLDSGLDKLASNSKVPFGEMDTEGLKQVLDSITIETSQMDFTVSEKSSTIALAELTSWKLKATVNKDAFVDAVINLQERAGVKDTAKMRTELSDSMKDADLSYDGDVVSESNDKLSIALVKESDRWYFSPIMTAAEAAYQASGSEKSPSYDADVEGAAGKASGTEAVQALLDRLSSLSGPDDLLSDDMVSLLSMPERRALMVYGPALRGDSSTGGDAGRSEYFKAEWRLTEHRVSDDLVIVGPGTSTITLNGDSSQQITFDGAKVTANGKTVDFGRALTDPSRLGIAAVRENGTWHVALMETGTNLVTLHGNEKGVGLAEQLVAKLGESSGLSWDDVDERNRAVLGGLMFFVDAGEQITGEDLLDQVDGLDSLVDPYGSSSTDDGYGYEDGTDDPYGTGDSVSGDSSGSDSGGLEADLGKLFGGN
ncbi:MAG: hypothetical protein LBE25_15665 [Arthrobacter sp.]|jgi:hypothetical protein|nr:hypothetical protein [Arthrobacter sp.]